MWGWGGAPIKPRGATGASRRWQAVCQTKQQNARHKLAGDPEVSCGDARSVRGARSYEQILFDKPKNQPTGYQRPEKATPRIMNRYFRDKLI